ncbi:short-chain dehydrogenase [Frondihabitans sp. PAMC 28766]|uniref:SDR family oxidoreductase n=1 Tax=Frondihabitans sp. PAMC 28766 TaxID=1795630 RepID=UPI00078D8783|nr:SDR family oxidoreductase [Frondihabitans sp. PAMC 28766]AMM19426.1 short-chain dehydrogenase [Frondihabitans sp. PAMC 28766]
MSKHVVVIIGAGGMGEQIARRQGAGKHLFLADFNEEMLASKAAALQLDGFEVTTQKVDVSSRDSVKALAEAAAAAGPVVEVIDTAGLSPTQAPIGAILNVDLLGVAIVLEEFAAVIADGGAGVVIASMAGQTYPGLTPEQEFALATTGTDDLLDLPFVKEGIADPGAAYGLSKRANQLRVKYASIAWGQRGGRVNSVSPGIISTPMGQQELDGPSGVYMKAMIEGSGTKRIGTPADIANTVSFLLGSEASFITGIDVLVDGGVIASVTTNPPAFLTQGA